MITAVLQEVLHDTGETKSLGVQRFVQLPAPGDRIFAIRDSAHQEMVVRHVLHRPFLVREGNGEPGATDYAAAPKRPSALAWRSSR